jgi:hypothetical protein
MHDHPTGTFFEQRTGMFRRLKTGPKVLIALVILVIGLRLALPYIVLRYLNRTLADLGDYTGRVEDVNIALLRGAYQIEGLTIEKIDGEHRQPFLLIPLMDLSVEWKSLFKGAIVGEIETYRPELHFSFSKNEADRQTGEEVDWVTLVKELMPIQINRFAVYDGQVAMLSLFDGVKEDVALKGLQAEIRNIRNVDEVAKPLPSPVVATGDVPGYGGTLKFNADFNLLKDLPDFDYDLRFDNLQLTKLNGLAKHYTGVDFERGTVSLYSEMAMREGQFNGYFKPLTNDMKIFGWNEGDGRTVGQFFKELLAEGATEILENQRADQFATRVPLQGNVMKYRTDGWSILINILWNAYVSAFRGQVDGTVTFGDAVKTIQDVRKQQRETRRAERDERRRERKAEREKRRAERRQ